jgi:hypothetical protein
VYVPSTTAPTWDKERVMLCFDEARAGVEYCAVPTQVPATLANRMAVGPEGEGEPHAERETTMTANASLRT